MSERTGIRSTTTCPDCGSHDLEDNGQTGENLSLLCTECGQSWDPNAD